MASPANVIFAPMAAEDTGLSAFNTTSGIGLVTMGFVWGSADIWMNVDPVRNTVWVQCSSCTGSC